MQTQEQLDQIAFMQKAIAKAEPKQLKSADEKISVDHLLFMLLICVPGAVRPVNGNLYMYINNYWNKIEDDLFSSYFLKRFIKRVYPSRTATVAIINSFKSEIKNNYFIFKQIPADTKLINMQNGMLSISKEEVKLLPHDAEYFMTNITDYPYQPEQKAPLFLKVVRHALQNDEATVTRLLEHFGYLYAPASLKLEKIPIFRGSGANSKSTILNCVIRMVGEVNVSYVEAHELGEEYKCANMANAMVNIGSDGESAIKASAIKHLASQEKIFIRNPYEKGHYIVPPKQMFAVNNDLKARGDDSYGITRRLDTFPFDVRISPDMIDPELDIKLAKETAGILNLALEHCINLMKNKKFTHSDLVEKAKNRYIKNTSAITRYTKECLIADAESRIDNKQLYVNYVSWCKYEGVRAQSKNELLSKLRDLAFITYKNNTTRGIKASFVVSPSLFANTPSKPANNESTTSNITENQPSEEVKEETVSHPPAHHVLRRPNIPKVHKRAV